VVNNNRIVQCLGLFQVSDQVNSSGTPINEDDLVTRSEQERRKIRNT